jgi:hypothetical protein
MTGGPTRRRPSTFGNAAPHHYGKGSPIARTGASQNRRKRWYSASPPRDSAGRSGGRTDRASPGLGRPRLQDVRAPWKMPRPSPASFHKERTGEPWPDRSRTSPSRAQPCFPPRSRDPAFPAISDRSPPATVQSGGRAGPRGPVHPAGPQPTSRNDRVCAG